MTFEDYIRRIMEQDKEILERLGSDYDEKGIPYWEKWGNKEEITLTEEDMTRYYGVYSQEDIDRID